MAVVAVDRQQGSCRAKRDAPWAAPPAVARVLGPRRHPAPGDSGLADHRDGPLQLLQRDGDQGGRALQLQVAVLDRRHLDRVPQQRHLGPGLPIHRDRDRPGIRGPVRTHSLVHRLQDCHLPADRLQRHRLVTGLHPDLPAGSPRRSPQRHRPDRGRLVQPAWRVPTLGGPIGGVARHERGRGGSSRGARKQQDR